MTFIIGTFQIHSKNERKQVKRSKDHMGDVQTVFFFIYKVVHYLNDFLNLFLHTVYLKSE